LTMFMGLSPDKLLTRIEVCELLNVTEFTLRRWKRTKFLEPTLEAKDSYNLYRVADISRVTPFEPALKSSFKNFRVHGKENATR